MTTTTTNRTRIMSALHNGQEANLYAVLDNDGIQYRWVVETTGTDVAVSFWLYEEASCHFLAVVERMF